MNESTLPKAESGDDPAAVERYQRVYEGRRSNLATRIQASQARLPELAERDARMNAAYAEKFGRPPEPGTFNELARGQAGLERLQLELEFLRPPTSDDIAYRNQVLDTFAQKVAATCPPGLPLRFQGTPIYRAREIIQSGGVSSSADRLGYETSQDPAGAVSVTTAETLGNATIPSYTDLHAENYCLPAGCVLAMLPASESDAKAGDSMMMSNADFRTEPRRLFGIVTTPENVPTVRQWAAEAELDPTKVTTFFEFTDQLAELQAGAADGSVDLQELIPYPLSETATA